MKLPSLNAKDHPLFNCGNINCPVCSKAYFFMKIKNKIIKLKENFSTDGISPFVGRFNYPNIYIGIQTPPEHEEDSWLYDAPKVWSEKNFQIPQIIDYRSSLINSRSNLNIKKRDKFIELNQEVAMSSKPVGVEVNLKEKPLLRMSFDNHMAPQGPRAIIKKASLTENPKINSKVEKVYSDTDLKANDALIYLYKNEFDENFLSRILSIGTLGIGKNRKLVPTRWSITATDDVLGRYLFKKIKYYNEIDYSAFFGNYLGNYYLVLCFPEVWSYELFEAHVSNVDHYMADYEPYDGRKYYAQNTAGGYYTARLAILEKLNQLKRQGSCIALRFITGDYTLPLGVWVTREAARKTMNSNPIKFGSKELMMEYAKKLIKKKFNVDLNILLDKSVLLRKIRTQSKLTKFI